MSHHHLEKGEEPCVISWGSRIYTGDRRLAGFVIEVENDCWAAFDPVGVLIGVRRSRAVAVALIIGRVR